jgi:hypothetical protein
MTPTTSEQDRELLELAAELSAYIGTRDRRIAKEQPWNTTPLLDYFKEMLAKGSVRVGGRATCGSYADPTWRAFRAWNEVVSKARKLGIAVAEEHIKHKNAWATKAGGFWDEREYHTSPNPALRDALALELPRNPRQLPAIAKGEKA